MPPHREPLQDGATVVRQLLQLRQHVPCQEAPAEAKFLLLGAMPVVSFDSRASAGQRQLVMGPPEAKHAQDELQIDFRNSSPGCANAQILQAIDLLRAHLLQALEHSSPGSDVSSHKLMDSEV